MDYVTIKIDENTYLKMTSYYEESEIDSKEYIKWIHKEEDFILTIYYSSKGYKAVFSGSRSLIEARLWDKEASINVKKEHIEYHYLDLDTQMGSDEVGTGDFFGPVVVVASFIKKEQLPRLIDLGIKDSKKLTDEKILILAPTLMDEVDYIKQIVPNEVYNKQIELGSSMNKIKAQLHNNALIKLAKRHPNTNTYIDQFCSINKYFSYLENEKEIKKDVNFHIKGESYYPSVAVSSIIARYLFLKEIEAINKKYQVDIPKGASSKVDEFALEFIKKNSLEELSKIIKINFKNYERIKPS